MFGPSFCSSSHMQNTQLIKTVSGQSGTGWTVCEVSDMPVMGAGTINKRLLEFLFCKWVFFPSSPTEIKKYLSLFRYIILFHLQIIMQRYKDRSLHTRKTHQVQSKQKRSSSLIAHILQPTWILLVQLDLK